MKAVGSYWLPDQDEFLVKDYKVDGGHDIDKLFRAMGHVETRECAIDGGAHAGSWSRKLSDLFNEVIAVEVEYQTYRCLQRNVQGFANVTAFHYALWDTSDVLMQTELRVKGNTGTFQVSPSVNGDGIRSVTVDDLVGARNVGLLKLDVEGAELQALRGAKGTLTRCNPVVIWEWGEPTAKRYGTTYQQIADYLTSLGYEELAKLREDFIWKKP